jgi:cellulose synthase/poly-beta-1,6-N-acetylglucosamine synthase-like glycosyltransferase
MISIVITSYKEPETIGKAIESFVKQKIKGKYELIVSAPDKETLAVARKYSKKYRQIKVLKDPGKGKSYAINWLLPKLKGEIVVLSDGDVYSGEDSVNRLIEPFRDSKVGCVTGRPVSQNSRDNMLGYWSHLLVDAGAHQARLKRARKGQFLECSAYLWAFRRGLVKDYPLDVAEDAIVPLLLWLRGYKIAYVPESIVYVKYPENLKDFVEQKVRTAKSHETLMKYVPLRAPRMKSFSNEILEGWKALFYPKSLKEIFWTKVLFFVRFYTWLAAFYEIKLKKREYKDAWKRVESTK